MNKDFLDNKQQQLQQKHQQRLKEMTRVALASQSQHSNRIISTLQLLLNQPITIMALASVLIISTVILLESDTEQPPLSSASLQVNASLPLWVKDTDIPIELLENMDFYVWLSQQQEYATVNNPSFLLAAGHHQFSPRQ